MSGGYMPGEPPVGIKAKAEQFREAVFRDGWGGENDVVTLAITENGMMLGHNTYDGKVVKLHGFEWYLGEWEEEVIDA